MNERGFWTLRDVSDVRLLGDLKGLLVSEGRIEARVVAHLAELDARRLHLKAGRSLFQYCLTELGLSDNQAFYRIVAARAARRFPILFQLLDERALHLTTLALIGKHLTQENHLELLRDVRGKTKRQTLELLARRFPKANLASEVRRLPPDAFRAGPTGALTPVSEARYRLQLDASAQLVQKLELARDLMSHANPSGDLAVVVERALGLLVENLQTRRFAQTSRPRRAPTPDVEPTREQPSTPVNSTTTTASSTDPGPTSTAHARPSGKRPAARAHIPSDVRRQLVERDGLQCTYCSTEGQRCTERAFLQIHHDQAWAKGGPDTLSNLRLLCASHNRLLAEQEFGEAKIRMAVGE